MKSKLELAKRLILEAGQDLKAAMSQPIQVEEKSGETDLVTHLDRDIQAFLMTEIAAHFPQDQFFAEENEVRHPIDDGAVWVLDPIDGTVNFLAQADDFTIMMAYFEDGAPGFGLIYDVMKDQLIYGGPDFGVFCGDQPLAPYQDGPLNRSLISSNAYMYAANVMGIRDLADHCLGVRVLGGAGVSMAKVLTGSFLAYFSHIYPWDYAAALVLGKALGYGLMTFDGQAPDFQSRQQVMFLPLTKLEEMKAYLKIP